MNWVHLVIHRLRIHNMMIRASI